MLKKIQRRFIISAMVAFGVVMLLLIIGINILNYVQMIKSQNDTLTRIFEYDRITSSESYAEKPPIYEMPWEREQGAEFTTRFFIVHCDESGNVKVFGNEYIFSVDEDTAEKYTKIVLEKKKDKGYYQDYRYEIQVANGDLTVAFLNVSEAKAFASTLLIVSLFIGVASLACVFILVLMLSKPAIKPYLKNVEMQKCFITDAGHELKTPITSIATSADIAAMEYGEDEWIKNIQKQSIRLTNLVNDLVMLSRLDEEMPCPEKMDFSLSEAAWEIAESFHSYAKAENKKYIIHIENQVNVYGDRGMVQRMLSILLDNALKYSTPGGEVLLAIYNKKNKAVIEVSNTCQIDEKVELSRLFERFYRPDESRSTNTGGSGLGLSIARAIVETHGGQIRADMEDESTIRLRVVL